MKDIKVGETFKFEGRTYILKENKNYDCNNCAFQNRNCTLLHKDRLIPQCISLLRKDKVEIEFVELNVKESE